MQREDIIKATPFLETEHLLLKPLDIRDAPAMFDILSPVEIHRKIAVFTSPMTMEQSENWCENVSHQITAKGKGYLAGVYNREAPEKLIGYAGISDPTEYGKSNNADIWEMGYWIDKSQQGHNYGTEAAAALIKFADEKLNLKGVFATTAADNNASGNVLLKNGFRFIKTDLMPTASGTNRPTNYYERNF